MPAVSKAQQRFMGMVHATQKGDMEAPSKEIEKAADTMKKVDAKDFASTKHKGLPAHVKERLKEIIRGVIRAEGAFGSVIGGPEDGRNLTEMSPNDTHFKGIMAMYDKGGSFAKKKVGAAVSKNPNASRNQIVDDLKDLDYQEILDAEAQLGLKETNLGEKGRYNGKEVYLDFPYLNEAKPSIIGNMNAYGAAQVLGKGKKVLGYIQDTPNAVATLIQDYPQAQEIKFKSSFIFGGDTYKTIKKTDKVWKELQKRYIDNSTKEALKKGFSINESIKEVLSKDTIVRTLTSDKNAYFLTKDGNGWILDITPKGAQQSTFHQKFNVKDLGKGHLGMKYKLTESVNEGKTYSNKFAAWFTGTVLNNVKHPTYGKHQLTADQIQKAPGDYKDKLFKAIEAAVKNGDITPDIIKKNESVNEDSHDCGCNENHDCGCGGVHEHTHIHEDLSADANGIAGLTASRASAVKDFLEKHNINSNKLYLSLKKGGLKDRLDFVTALVGKPGNPIQKKVISQFSK